MPRINGNKVLITSAAPDPLKNIEKRDKVAIKEKEKEKKRIVVERYKKIISVENPLTER